MRPSNIVHGMAVVAVVVLSGVGVSDAASTPSEDDLAAGLVRVLTEIGDVTYEGNDIRLDGACPLTNADEVTAAFAPVLDGAALTAEQSSVEMPGSPEYELGETFTPALISCEFASTAELGVTNVGILAGDAHDAEVLRLYESFTAQASPLDVDPLPFAGEFAGWCDSEFPTCLFGWLGRDVAVAAVVEFDSDTMPDLAAAGVPFHDIVDAVTTNLATGPTSTTTDTVTVGPNDAATTDPADGTAASDGSAPGGTEIQEIHAFCTGPRARDEYKRRYFDEVAEVRRGALADHAESEGLTEDELIDRLLDNLLARQGDAIVIHGALDDDNSEGLSELGLLYGVVFECIADTTRIPDDVLTLLDETDYDRLVEASWEEYHAEWIVSEDTGLYFRLWTD